MGKVLLLANQNFFSYDIIYTKKTKIYFALEPLNNRRGIGRVTQEYFKNLKLICKDNLDNKELKSAYFYSSIHFVPENPPKNSIIMILDVIPMVLPELFPKDSKVWLNKYKNVAHKAKHIITISQTSKNDIIKFLDIPKNRVSIINIGVTRLINSKAEEVIGLPHKFFVYVGSDDKHKNLTVILKAIAKFECKYKLIMIGNNSLATDIVKELNIQKQVIFLGRLSDKQLNFVIKKSIALLFPSFYEGFGLPPMEAALLKVPSICSNRPTMTEFLEDIALFADVNSADEWSKQMFTIANNIKLRDELIQKAYKKISKFKWEESSRKLLEIIDELK